MSRRRNKLLNMSLAGAGNNSARDVSQCPRSVIVHNTFGTEDEIHAPGAMQENQEDGVHHEVGLNNS